MTADDTHVHLSITVDRDTVMAGLTFTNNSGGTAYIDRINGSLDGVIRNHVFSIRTDGVLVPYRGVLAKRRRPGLEDGVALQPGASGTATADLTREYAFLPGTHDYQVSYSAFHQFPNRPGFVCLASGSVSFVFTGTDESESRLASIP